MSEPLSSETVRMVVISSMFTFKRVLSLMFAETETNICLPKSSPCVYKWMLKIWIWFDFYFDVEWGVINFVEVIDSESV